MSDLDQKLLHCHRTRGYAESEWREIAEHVIGKLAVALGDSIATSEMEFSPHGFSGDIESIGPFAGEIKLSWFGRIGATVVGRDEATALEAIIFVRGCGQRLVTADGGAYLWLVYGEQAPGEFGWSAPRWLADEYGEYEHWR